MEDEPRVEETETTEKTPSLFRNYISFGGAFVVFTSLACIVLLFLIEITGSTSKPYLGILTYMIFPTILVFGLFVVLVGMLLERRRRRKLSTYQIAAYPILDLNNPKSRRSLYVFLTVGFFFLFASAFGSYRAYEFTETDTFCGKTCHTVMNPEYTAYKASAHARVACVGCHVGPGAGWYVRSKLSGAYQVYSVAFNKYPRPITTPVHNLRPAQDTCEQCHWPEKFFGAQMKVFNRYAYDEQNTRSQTRMLINVGGGSPITGQVAGIHWHMNIANQVTYASSDEQRQSIPWVRIKDRMGNVTEYTFKGATINPEQLASMAKRDMDCVDCHNRPAHVYVPPDAAVNDSLVAERLDVSLPYLKRQAVELLTRQYATNGEAMKAISDGLTEFYQKNYPDVYSQKGNSVKAAITEVQRIFQTFIFPEMRVDWTTHPNNIGHYYFQGCFRCHDGQHVSNTGKVIKNDCNICHTVLDQTNKGLPIAVKDGGFTHPIELGNLSSLNCSACHKGNAAFQHPVKLGDLTQFKCVDCHAGKVWGKNGT